MAQLSRRVQRLAKQLGVSTLEDVQKTYREDSNLAATRVVQALQKILDEIRASSPTGVFTGYKVVKEQLSDTSRIRLRKSGLEVTGKFDWLIYVEKSGSGDQWNLFDVLDEGRKSLPFRIRPYPLWGAALREKGYRKRGPEPFPSNSRIASVGATGSGRLAYSNPLGKAGSADFGGRARPRTGKGFPMVFSQGPISAIKEKKLYERALVRAKEALKGTGFVWEVVIVQRDTRG